MFREDQRINYTDLNERAGELMRNMLYILSYPSIDDKSSSGEKRSIN